MTEVSGEGEKEWGRKEVGRRKEETDRKSNPPASLVVRPQPVQ